MHYSHFGEVKFELDIFSLGMASEKYFRFIGSTFGRRRRRHPGVAY